jgi:YidC/Oxa1 family membrane protein insertase
VDNRRLLLAAFLSMALVIAWTFLFPPKPPVKPVPPASGTAGQTAAAPSAAESPAPPAGTETPPPGAASAPEAPPAAPAQPVAAVQEEKVVLQSGLSSGGAARAVISNRGAQLISFEVPNKGGKEAQLDLVRQRAEGPYPYGLVDATRAPHPLNNALFVVEPGADNRSATLRYSGPEGTAEKTFRFDDEGFLDVSFKVTAPKGWAVVLGPGLRTLTADELASRYELRAAVYKTDAVQVVDPQKSFEAVTVPADSLRWIGLEDTYFLSATVPQKGLDRAVVEPFLVDPGKDPGKSPVRFLPMPAKDDLTSEQKAMTRELRVVLKPAGGELALRSYWGPKSYETLKSLPYGFEETVSWGSLRVLVAPLLAAIHWLHDHVVDNYGWAIVLMTVLIKLALLPLTHTSMKSMKKMQVLNPEMQKIRERYRTKLKDKQGRPNLEMQRKMNDEMMALYKEHGVNPAGGCLPIVLQMPILFAFYRLLSTAFELRGAPWILWIRDLSAADPHYVLPIVMGATQFLQVRLSPQTGDPMQRRMFMLMPLIMTIFFYKMPSGLVLYWLTNNVLTILQQGVYNRLQQKPA